MTAVGPMNCGGCMDGWSWPEAIYQLIGAAFGVLVGYGASEWIAGNRRADELKAVRSSSEAEVEHNRRPAVATQQQSAPNSFGASISTMEFSRKPRPRFATPVWDTYFTRVPDALTAAEFSRLL